MAGRAKQGKAAPWLDGGHYRDGWVEPHRIQFQTAHDQHPIQSASSPGHAVLASGLFCRHFEFRGVVDDKTLGSSLGLCCRTFVLSARLILSGLFRVPHRLSPCAAVTVLLFFFFFLFGPSGV